MSTSLGVTLCEDCAAAHRQLTWAVSKLKSIELDEFYDWQLEMMLVDLGNDVVNSIWEISIPAGWLKPNESSTQEDKTQFIVAKYRWYGFVDEFRVKGADQLIEGIVDSSIAGRGSLIFLISRMCSSSISQVILYLCVPE